MPARKTTKSDSTDREKRFRAGIDKFSKNAEMTAYLESQARKKKKDPNTQRGAIESRARLEQQKAGLNALKDSVKADSVKRGLKKGK